MSFNPHEQGAIAPGEPGRSEAGAVQPRPGTDASTSPTPAVRGGSAGREAWTGMTDGTGLPTFLAWFGIGLGAMELLAPRELLRLIGLRPTGRKAALVRTMGVREVATGLGILANPKSKEWVGMRVGGDLLDLGLLGAGLARSERPARTLGATGLVLGTTMLDMLGTEEVAERRKARSPDQLDEPGSQVVRSVTVEKPVNEVYAFWRDYTNFPRFMAHLEFVEMLSDGRSRWRAAGPAGTRAEWEAEVTEERENEVIAWRSVEPSELFNSGRVTFHAAPGGGTVVTVSMRYAPPGGKIGAAMLKLFRKEPGQQVGDDLRRFKQIMETGEVLLSDASVTKRPHAARPPRPEELH